MSKLYSSDNITVVVAGGINTAKTESLVNKYFGKMPNFDTIRYKKVVDSQTKPLLLLKHKQTEQVHIALGVRTVKREHPDEFPLTVLSAILGGGMSSRLFHEVREKRGLAYYVNASSSHYQDCGSLVSFAGIDPKRADEAITVMLDQYLGLASNKLPISNRELKKAKEFTKGHTVLEFEDSRAVAVFYATQELLDEKIDNLEDILLKIDKVTKEDVERVAKKYITKKTLNLAVIGNFSDGQRFEKLLRL